MKDNADCNKKAPFVCILMGSELADSEIERHLGVVAESSMNILTCCAAAVKKTYSVQHIIKTGIASIVTCLL